MSKVLELLLFPMFVEFGKKHGLKIDLCPQQNFYPDLTFIHEPSGQRFAVDIKSTYRTSDTEVNGMTLGAFTGYFRKRDSNKNILLPYNQYAGHFVLGVIYSKCDEVADKRKQFTLDDLPKIPSAVKNFQFFAQPKYRIVSSRPGSGNTKNIGSVIKIAELANGTGPFASLGEEVYDDYWMFYLARDMAQALSLERPYTNLKTYLEYKERGVDTLRAHEKEIATLASAQPGDLVYADPPYAGRHVDYFNSWSEADETELGNLLKRLPCRFILSTWHSNEFRTNAMIEHHWNDPRFHLLTREHFYHVGSTEDLRHPMIEALITDFPGLAPERESEGSEQMAFFERPTPEHSTS